MPVRRCLWLVLVLLSWPAPAESQLRTFYVATTGSDLAPGTSDEPWRTLERASNGVQAGDLVIVRAGTYAGFDLRISGTQANPIEFRAEASVTVNAPNPVTPDHGINIEGASWVVIQGFTVNGMPRTGIRSVLNHHVTIRGNTLNANGRWGVLTGFSDDVLIENNIASNSVIEHGIYVSNSGDRPIIRKNQLFGNNANGVHMNGDVSLGGDGIITGALVEGNIIHNNGTAGGSGINADGVQGSRFQNNLIYGNHASGISLYQIDGGGPSINNVVAHNTIVQASDARWAINITDAATGNTVHNNILYNFHGFRGSITISSDSLAGLVSDYNVVMDRFTTDDGDTIMTLAQWQVATGQDMHSLIAVPADLFVNIGTNDYHLKPASPAKDAGLTLAAVTVDIDGVARPSGPAVDIGAYEVPVPTLTVTRRGSATGTITSSPAGINCGGTCSASFTAGATVTLTAAPEGGASFVRWTGACTGTVPECMVSTSGALTATATFGRIFTDEPLGAATTLVKVAHLLELRAAIDSLRAWRSLSAISWTDQVITAGVTPIHAAHLIQLRSALDGVYVADALTPPAWGAAPVAGVTTITAAHFQQVGTAIRAVE